MRPWKQFEVILASHCPVKEIVDLYIPVRAIGKERPRSHRTPIKTRTWITGVAKIIKEQLQEQDYEPITRPVSCRYIIGYHEGRHPDIDNIEKALFEALQRGDKSGEWRAVEDDNLIRGYVEKAEHLIPKEQEPFIWVRLYEPTT